ncbi:MAG: type I DNA topoisomerase [Paludibacteraceae bacterium]|nr:type I DNA topoisomerase [Paludibacteraceae bacterium]
MSKNLVIVESPAKAKTIEKFLGEGYHVLSSQGHIRDIAGIGKNSMGIDFQNGYMPNYVLDESKQKLIQSLRTEAKKADTVWLASDEDREGEAIAWHLKEVLNLKPANTKRIVFHEITKEAIQNAILTPRDIDYNLVNAQQARRVMDRIVGFELSPILWRKIATGLSAGRVQSVAVRLIVEREQEIEDFKATPQYRVNADFIGKDASGKEVVLHTELSHRFATEEETLAFLESCKDAEFMVQDIQKKPGKKSPAPPFTTSLLQQEAARKLHFPVSKTMRIAQSLYEAGKITYMRTDSVNLSQLAINTSKKEILSEFGESYHKMRTYKTNAKGAQEAHEAIRPTYMDARTIQGTSDEKHLYELIWKRTLASQMADAQVETTRIEVSNSKNPYLFVASGEVVVFDGFMRMYVQSTDDDEQESNSLPLMIKGSVLKAAETIAQEVFTKAPQRYNEGSLVKRMEELGIGRPSTYATIIETIQSRGYVENGNVPGSKREYQVLTLKNGKITSKHKHEMVGADSHKLLPSDLGRISNNFLVEQFPEVLSYDFTAEAEMSFDQIAEGQADWQKVVDSFYNTFHPSIEDVPVGKIPGRELGVDPQTGMPVTAKISKGGPCVQLGSTESDEKPRFASIPKGKSIYTITLEEALELFSHSLPYTLGEIDGKEVIVGSAKYGPFIRIDNGTSSPLFVSIPKNIDPLSITIEQASELIAKKQQSSEPIHVFGDIQVLHGRYGAYIKCGEKNYKIPHTQNVEELTEEACRAIIAATPDNPEKSTRYYKRK